MLPYAQSQVCLGVKIAPYLTWFRLLLFCGILERIFVVWINKLQNSPKILLQQFLGDGWSSMMSFV